VLKPVFHELFGEIRRSLDYYQAQSSERSLKKIILSGGSSKIRNIEKLIAQETKLQVEKSNPFASVKLNLKSPAPEELPEMQPLFPVAMGLALRVRS